MLLKKKMILKKNVCKKNRKYNKEKERVVEGSLDLFGFRS